MSQRFTTALGIAFLGPLAHAQQFTPLEQIRSAQTAGQLLPCDAEGSLLNDFAFAPDFAPFDADLVHDAHCPDAKSLASVLAAQHSAFDSRTVSITADAHASLTLPVINQSTASAQSNLDLVLGLDQDADAILVVDLSAEALHDPAAIWFQTLRISSNDGTILYEVNRTGSALDDPFSLRTTRSLRLTGPAISITAWTAANAFTPTSSGTHEATAHADIRLSLISNRCPADLNADGILDADDLFLFMDLFAVDDPLADRDANAVVDAQDFFMYLDEFVLDCP